MSQISNSRQYDLEERTLNFAKRVILFTSTLNKTIANIEIIKQLIRSAGSVGANYIEANESLSKKDFAFRVKISKKEAKETCYWLRLLSLTNESQAKEQTVLIKECSELMKIFGSILEKVK